MVVPGFSAGDILVMHTLRGRPQLIFILYLNITLITLQAGGHHDVNYINIISPTVHKTNQERTRLEINIMYWPHSSTVIYDLFLLVSIIIIMF